MLYQYALKFVLKFFVKSAYDSKMLNVYNKSAIIYAGGFEYGKKERCNH